MRTYFVAFLLSFGVAAGLTPLCCAVASRLGGMDGATSSRKVHREPMPRIGGIAIVFGFFAPLVGLFLWENSVSALFLGAPARVVGLFVAGLGIAALGLYDDFLGVAPRTKLGAQLAIATLLFVLDYRVTAVANPFGGGPIELGAFAFPLTVLWIVGVVNAVNLIDGLDGLAAGVAGIVVASTFAMAVSQSDVLTCLLMAALGGAIGGFLFYNVNPAVIFMGDTGSMFLGFVLAAGSVATNRKSSTAVALFVPIVALGLPITDTLLAVVRRALGGRPIFSADREHIHHRLLSKGFTQWQAVLVLYAACIGLAAVAFVLVLASQPVAALGLTALAAMAGLGLRRLGCIELTQEGIHRLLAERGRNRALHRAVHGSLEALSAVNRADDIMVGLAPFGLAVGASSLTLSLESRQGSKEDAVAWSWRWSGALRHTEVAKSLRIPVGEHSRTVGEMTVAWSAPPVASDRDIEIACERAARDVAATLRRIAVEPAIAARKTGSSDLPQGMLTVGRALNDATGT